MQRGCTWITEFSRRSYQAADRSGFDPNIVADFHGRDSNRCAGGATISPRAVKVRIADAGVSQNGVAPDSNLGRAPKACSTHHYVVTDDDTGVRRVCPCVHAPPQYDVVAKDNRAWSTNAEATERAEPAAGVERDRAPKGSRCTVYLSRRACRDRPVPGVSALRHQRADRLMPFQGRASRWVQYHSMERSDECVMS